MIHLLGLNSFIGKNFYLLLKKKNIDVLCLSHNELNLLNVYDGDIIINFCGVNRSNSYDDYEHGNYLILHDIYERVKNKDIYFIHLSSSAVNGFVDTDIENLSNYMQYFIKSKLKGEEYLKNKFNNLLILRPSNIFGYNCEPYYNNILVSLIYEKINGFTTINNLNKNCVRNYLSIDGLINTIYNLMIEKTNGTYNIFSNNNVNLEFVCNCVYDIMPTYININNGEISLLNTNVSNCIIINENLQEKINMLESDMRTYLYLKNNVEINKLTELVQPRGNMIEISELNSERLYKITLNKNSIRGNHYHDVQTEDFFVNKGHVYFMLSHKNNLNIVYQFTLFANSKVRVKPEIVHTLINDFENNEPEIFICSTQKYIENIVLDTTYVNII